MYLKSYYYHRVLIDLVDLMDLVVLVELQNPTYNIKKIKFK